METPNSGGRRGGCFKSGCFGCLGVLLLLILVAVGVGATALILGPPDHDIVDPGIVREVPEALRGRVVDTGGDEPREVPDEALSPGEPLDVVLDLSGGEFEIVAVEAGSPILVDGSYNAGAFELTERLERKPEGWTYHVRFARNVSWVRMLYGNQHEENRIRIALPRDLFVTLRGKVRAGRSRLDLGGLRLAEVDLEMRMGEHRLAFDRPSPASMSRFALAASQGSFEVKGLGNASPATVLAEGRMGELRLDLRGEWQNDAEIEAHWTMGECSLRVPEDVRIDRKETAVFLGELNLSGMPGKEPLEEGRPTLTLRLEGSMGEVRVAR